MWICPTGQTADHQPERIWYSGHRDLYDPVTSMSIYGLYSGTDGQSHLIELKIVGSGPPLQQPLPCQGWRPFQCAPGIEQSHHPTPVAGMTIMLNGCMEISVNGGTLRHVALRRGDMLLVLDTRGAGHATAITGTEQLQVAGVTFASADWPAIRPHFSPWPDNVLDP